MTGPSTARTGWSPSPITDDHIHLDPVNGRGIEAAKDFARAGGTHLFLVCKPSESFGVLPGSGGDFGPVYEGTIRVAEAVAAATGLGVYPVLGVHPAELTRLTATGMALGDAAAVMMDGLDLAGRFVGEGRAVALKSGRPHYEVPEEVLEASNEVLFHALELGSDLSCAVQIHAESGPCADVAGLARKAGLDPGRVVKHYSVPETPLIPSMLASHPEIPAMCREGRRFTLESDYMDENSRPGAVIGPKSVPRYTRKLFEAGQITEDDLWRIHSETPSRVYGVDIGL